MVMKFKSHLVLYMLWSKLYSVELRDEKAICGHVVKCYTQSLPQGSFYLEQSVPILLLYPVDLNTIIIFLYYRQHNKLLRTEVFKEFSLVVFQIQWNQLLVRSMSSFQISMLTNGWRKTKNDFITIQRNLISLSFYVHLQL